MFSQIKRLGADTAVYGISSIVARLLNFLLVPFYANVFTPAEYGIVATVYSYIAFFNIFYSYGMESAYFRFASGKEIGSDKENFSTPFISILITSVLFSSAFILFADPLTSVFQISHSFYRIIYYTAGILFFDALAIIPFASLRLQRRAKLFATLKVVNIVLTILLNLYSVLVLQWGIEGIFFSNLAASVITFVLLLPVITHQFEFRFHRGLYSELLKFGLPIVPVGLAGIVLAIADRPILKMLMDDASVGIYQANYRLGIFMNAVVGMFEYAWRPFFLSHAKDPDAKKLYARVMTYFLLTTSAIFLVLSFFISDIIQYKFFELYILPPPYWDGLKIVPIILLGYIFSGIGTNLNAGIQIEKKTMYLLPTALAGSVSNVALNFLLIPVFGIMGAAYATLIGYAAVAISLYIVVQKFYYIEYEFTRIAKLTVTVVGAMLLFKIFDPAVPVKFILIILWLGSLFAVRFFNAEEMNKIRSIVSRKTT